MMTILICLIIAYLAAVAGFWFVIAVIWNPWAEYREWQSGLKAKGEMIGPICGQASLRR